MSSLICVVVGILKELKKLTAAPAEKAGPWLKNAKAVVSVNTVLNRLQTKAVALLSANE